MTDESQVALSIFHEGIDIPSELPATQGRTEHHGRATSFLSRQP